MAAVSSIPQNPSAEFTPLLETLTRRRPRGKQNLARDKYLGHGLTCLEAEPEYNTHSAWIESANQSNASSIPRKRNWMKFVGSPG